MQKNPTIRRGRVIHEPFGLRQIRPHAIILYIGAESDEVTPAMLELSKKFEFIDEYKEAERELGDPIKINFEKYVLYGCIVRKTTYEEVNFIHFQHCIDKINADDTNDYLCVAIEDLNNDVLTAKLVNLITHTLTDLDLHICVSKNDNPRQ